MADYVKVKHADIFPLSLSVSRNTRTTRSLVLAFIIRGTARCNYDKVNVRLSGGPAGSTLDRRGFWV